MWRYKVLILTIPLILAVEAQNKTVKDDGYLGTCPLGIFDLTLSSSSTNSLKIYLVLGNGFDSYHLYNMSKAASLIKDEEFRKDYRTVLYAHGFNDRPGRFTSPRIVDAYQTRGRHNILLLDCSSLTSFEPFRSFRATRYIGIRLGKILAQWARTGMNMQTLDLVGHSLGAHILGHAGKSYFKSTGKKLNSITALDPGGPCFRNVEPEERLDKSDAEFVQVIHTNGGELGLWNNIGHMDFYVNGGRRQPSTYGVLCYLACSHDRVIDIWKFAVIYPNKFVGMQCMNIQEVEQDKCIKKGRRTAILGPGADPRVKGIFYVRTTNIEPYFVGPASEAYYDNCY